MTERRVEEYISIVKGDLKESAKFDDPQLEAAVSILEKQKDILGTPDTKVYRAAVYAVAATVLISILGAVILSFKLEEIPDILSVTAGAAIGALAGMLKQR